MESLYAFDLSQTKLADLLLQLGGCFAGIVFNGDHTGDTLFATRAGNSRDARRRFN